MSEQPWTPFSPPAVGYVHAVPYPRWQKCPICEGTGYVYPKGPATLSPDLCDVCDGQKVLDSWTGLPTKTEPPLDVRPAKYEEES